MNGKSQNIELIIEAGRAGRHYWKDLWRYRELFLFLAWRDILVRYKQTIFGIAWAIIRPLTTMIIFTVIFGRIAKLPSEGIVYPLMVFVATLPWQLFASTLSQSSSSLIGNAGLISRIYFPRIIIPTTSMIVGFIDFLISSIILVIMMIIFKVIPNWRMLFIPFFVVWSLITALGGGLIFSSLNVKYRDFRYIVPFVVQFGLYISPVGFSSSVVPQKFRLIYSINPMVGVIDGFRWSILGTDVQLYLPGFIVSIIISLLLFILGIKYFRNTEKTFADVI